MKFSVVMSTYNGEKFLLEQLESIKNQTYGIDEVIIKDDCSTDNTVALIRQYIADNNLNHWHIYVNKINQGYKKNFTELLHLATGDYIFLADQDDIWHNDKAEKMINIVSSYSKILLLASDLNVIYMSKKAPKVHYERFGGKLIKIGFSKRWLKPSRPGCSFLIKKELINYYDRYWTEDMPHDCALWNVACLRDSTYFFNEKLMDYRRHEENASNLGGHSVGYRIQTIANELELIDRASAFTNSLEKKDFLAKQREVYLERIKIIKNKKILKAMYMLFAKSKYYAQRRYTLTDIYYCFKKE